MSKALYLYCIARAPLKVRQDVHAHRDLAAVVERVSVRDFREENLKNVKWVGPRVVRHQRVIEQVMKRSPVFPARFGALFSSEKALDRMLDRHHGAISEFLSLAESHEEWAVKALLDRAAAEKKLAAKTKLAHLPPGMRYLKKKSATREGLEAWISDAAGKVSEELAKSSVRVREMPILPGGDKEVVGNWAVLLKKGTKPKVQGHGLAIDVSGPWPAYSFCPSLT